MWTNNNLTITQDLKILLIKFLIESFNKDILSEHLNKNDKLFIIYKNLVNLSDYFKNKDINSFSDSVNKDKNKDKGGDKFEIDIENPILTKDCKTIKMSFELEIKQSFCLKIIPKLELTLKFYDIKNNYNNYNNYNKHYKHYNSNISTNTNNQVNTIKCEFYINSYKIKYKVKVIDSLKVNEAIIKNKNKKNEVGMKIIDLLLETGVGVGVNSNDIVDSNVESNVASNVASNSIYLFEKYLQYYNNLNQLYNYINMFNS